MADTISNMDNTIDSRDVIERIEELQGEIEAEEEALREAQADGDNDADDIKPDTTCGTCGASWNDTLSSSRTPAPGGRCPFEASHGERAELATLLALQDEADSYCSDWEHGMQLIRDSYFEDYARQLAEDIGAIDTDIGWPSNCIDWGQATSELQQDYTSVDFDGVTYWVR